MRYGYVFLFSLLIFPLPVFAETLTLESVWQQIHAGSKTVEAAVSQLEVSQSAELRAKRHWLPRVYLDAKGYRTNDPGASFFGLIQQRSLLSSDFNPDLINRPAAETYVRGALGLDLALYEGGMKSSQVEAMSYSRKAQELVREQVNVEQFSEVAKVYGSLSLLLQQKTRLESLKAQVQGLLSKYQLGNRSNPVGYSGLLGMQALSNRLVGLLNQYEAQAAAYQRALVELGLKDELWQPQLVPTEVFMQKYFSRIVPSSDKSSYKVQSLKESAKAGSSMASMEKARFLPRVGAFAESYMFNGSRDTANGYMAGVYLQWNLFNSSDYGLWGEGKARALASEKYAQALEQQERVEKSALMYSLDSYRKNIKLLNESYKLLEEQSKIASTLFRNGSITALQVVEILNRKADLIDQYSQAELGLIQSVTALASKQAEHVDKYISSSRTEASL